MLSTRGIETEPCQASEMWHGTGSRTRVNYYRLNYDQPEPPMREAVQRTDGPRCIRNHCYVAYLTLGTRESLLGHAYDE
jgi:hypothetical protein